MSLDILDDPKWRRRAFSIKVMVGCAIAVVGGWAALGLPIVATRGHVAAEVAPVRIDALETRQEITELKLFLLDWTLRQSPMDNQARAMIEAEKSRTLDRKSAINSRLEQARR